MSDSFLGQLSERFLADFESKRHILSFEDFIELVEDNPARYARSSAQYLYDALAYFGTEEIERGGGTTTRYKLFDAPYDDGEDRVVGNEHAQQALETLLSNFVSERRINRLILLHGPNGSAKSSMVSCLMRALEAYSRTEEGAIYTFNWVFPSAKVEQATLGFGSGPKRREARSFAYLDEEEVDAKLPAEHNDNPIFLLPRESREELLAGVDHADFVLSDSVRRGDLGQRSRAIFDALLSSYHGDLRQVLRHVQVERFYFSKLYRRGAVTVEPQLRVDAGVRQLTMDRSLASLPRVLQAQTLFEPFGALVEGNRGMVEYNDLFKRPMEANKYLLATSEKGTVSMDSGEMRLDAVLIATANEDYLEAFKQQPDFASWKGRIELVRMPYLLDYRAEQGIYDDLVTRLEITKPRAPHTTFVAALWAVLTRLVRPDEKKYPEKIRDIVQNLSPLDKALLYAEGRVPAGLTSDQARELLAHVERMIEEGRSRDAYEGRYGASAREMKTIILNAAHSSRETFSPTAILEELARLVKDRSVYQWLRLEPKGAYHRPDQFIADVRGVYLDRVEREVRLATGLVDESEYMKLFARYISHSHHWLRSEKIYDEVTGRETKADVRMLEEVENTLGREEDAREFRSRLISQIAAFRIDNPEADVDYQTIFPRYFELMRREFFESKRETLLRIQENLLRYMDEGPDRMDRADVALVEETMRSLETDFGYTTATSKEAIAILLRERYAAEK